MPLSLLLLSSLRFHPAAAEGQDSLAPGREVSLPKEQIGERFLAWLAGAIQRDLPVNLDRDGLAEMFPEFQGKAQSPFQLLATVRRRTDGMARPARLIFSFSGPLHVPVPFVVPL